MFTLTVYLVQHSLVDEIMQTAPPGMPNVFLIGITPEQVEPLQATDRQTNRRRRHARVRAQRCRPHRQP